MLRFDMATQELTNVTVEGPRFHNGHVQYAKMIYVLNFWPKGIFAVLGGVTKNPETDLLDWTTVTVFDPSEEKWYDRTQPGTRHRGERSSVLRDWRQTTALTRCELLLPRHRLIQRS